MRSRHASALVIGIMSIGTPPVRWFPLAPREVYVPYYRSSRTHVRHVNEPHVRDIRNLDDIVVRPHEVVRRTRFIHRDEPRAVSVAPVRGFREDRPEPRMRDARREDDRPRQIEHRQRSPAVKEPPRPRTEERRPSREARREAPTLMRTESREAKEPRTQVRREERRPERHEQRERREQRDDRNERKQRSEDERRR